MTRKTNPPRIVACIDCPAHFKTRARGNRTKRCPECQYKHVKQLQRERYARMKKLHEGKPYTLIFDPIPFNEGGFRSGVRFSDEELKTAKGYIRDFILAGTVLTKNKEIFTVVSFRKKGLTNGLILKSWKHITVGNKLTNPPIKRIIKVR